MRLDEALKFIGDHKLTGKDQGCRGRGIEVSNAGGRRRWARLLLTYPPRTVTMVLHTTEIAEINVDHIRLHAGGWRTATTRDALNIALQGWGYHIFADRNDWYISANNGRPAWIFRDGMTLEPT